VSLFLEFSKELSNNFTISLTSEVDIRKIFVLDFRMIVNDAIMDKENSFILVIVRVAISFVHLSTCSPSCVCDTNRRVDTLFRELLDKSLNTV